MSYNDVYYRVLAGKNHEPMVCCLQDFDEPDYDAQRWLTEQKFETEELAEDWILYWQISSVLTGTMLPVMPFSSRNRYYITAYTDITFGHQPFQRLATTRPRQIAGTGTL